MGDFEERLNKKHKKNVKRMGKEKEKRDCTKISTLQLAPSKKGHEIWPRVLEFKESR
jgi:hypothetical protein